MNPIYLVCFAVAVVMVATIIAVRYHRRKQRSNIQNRQRSVLSELEDEVIWEIGKERPILDIKGASFAKSRRDLLKGLTRGALVSVAALMATNGVNFTAYGRNIGSAKQLSASSDIHLLDHTDTAHTDTPHTDTPHNDNHTDETVDDHYDVHGNHIDYAHVDANTQTNGHVDQPHTDDPNHSDTHTDNHTDRTPSPHTDVDHNDKAHVDTPHTDTP